MIIQELKDDKLSRRNVFAILLGEKDNNGDTLILHGHTDTVGLEGYGAAKDYACKPDELEKILRKMNLSEEVRKDLESGEYMFGRGTCDMKSGDAVFLGILKKMSECTGELSGNIVLSLNSVEENLHTGIIEGLDVLKMLKETYHLNYVLSINNDYYFGTWTYRTDVIINHMVLNEATKDYFNKEFFRNLKKHSIFINVGRGGSVDEKALQEALEEISGSSMGKYFAGHFDDIQGFIGCEY